MFYKPIFMLSKKRFSLATSVKKLFVLVPITDV
jgi:hypothetical protein